MPTTATDTELVRQYLAGDQRALGDIYERYGDRVYDLCFAMLRSGDDAADAYQDTFLTAANKLDQLRDTERLRSWLYSVARNQCRARLRARKRSTPVDDAGVDVGTEVDMTADLGRDELRTLLTEASAGLNEREREVLDLHMRHELEGEELADALGVSVQNAYKLVQRVRDRVERSLGSLLIARHGRRECAELDTLLGSWDGVFNPLWRKRISRHIDDCSTCTRRRAGLMDPGGLAGAFPLQPAPETAKTALQAALLDATRPAHEIRRWRRDGFPAAPRRIPKLLFTAVAGGTLVVGGLVGGLAVTELIDRTDPQLETVAPAETTTSTTSTPATTTLPSSTTTTTQSTAPATTTTAAPTTTPTTTTPPTTTAAPTTTPTTTTTTTVPIDTEAPTINSIAPTPTGKSTP
ncbi:MAG: sigma-70 family RNA polymerase sigma factor, partial [Actinomycetota bacterium]|nr:sigma-70 family RNA polymerase sigma factor [Actinomycetota bacterium]